MQNDDAIEQWPEVQSCEQHSELCVQALPEVLHDLLSAMQLPPEHAPLQQSAPVVHACPSDTHACVPHFPPTHESEQHSIDVVHGAPAASQLTGDPPMQAPILGSQRPEQQSASLAQCEPELAQRLVPPKLNPPSPDTLPDAPPHPLARAAAVVATTSAASACCASRNSSTNGHQAKSGPDAGSTKNAVISREAPGRPADRRSSG
jgi:hypothetical protein